MSNKEIKELKKKLSKANENDMIKIMNDIEKKSNELYKTNMSSSERKSGYRTSSERKSKSKTPEKMNSKKDYSIKELQDILDKY